jgi:hypothetical protein
LKVLTRDQDRLISGQTRLMNQLVACLKDFYPVALNLFLKLHQPSTLVFLQTCPLPQEAMAASVEQIEQVLKNTGHPMPEKVAAKTFETLYQPHQAANAITICPKSYLMLVLVKQLLALVDEIAVYDEEIARLFLRNVLH